MLTRTGKSPTVQSVITQKQVFIFPLLSGLLLVGLVIFLVLPMLGSIMDSRKELKKEQDRLDKLVLKREQLEELSEEQLVQELMIVNRLLPSRKPIVEILGSMAGAASDSAISINNYEFSPGEVASDGAEAILSDKPGLISSLAVTLGIEGKYSDILAYLRTLRQTAPILDYQTVKLDGQLKDELVTEFSSDIELKVLFSAPPSTKGKITDPLPPMSNRKDEMIEKALAYKEFTILTTGAEAGVENKKPDPFSY